MKLLKYFVFGIMLSSFESAELLASVPDFFPNRTFAESHDQRLANDERESLAPILLASETSTTTTTTKEKTKTNDGNGNKSKTKTKTTTTTTTTTDDTNDNSNENTGSETTRVSREGW